MSVKFCLRDPIPAIYDAAKYLDAAVSAHLSGHDDIARQLFVLANDKRIWDWSDSIWGANSPFVNVTKLPSRHVVPKTKKRMPNKEMKEALHKRDGFHCRFCGIPLIHADIRKYFHKIYPNEVPWGRTNASQHAGFQCMWLQYDHVVPHTAGGENSLDNLILTCAPCNFGKMEFLVEELGLEDPRLRPPVRSAWDGLMRVWAAN